jgi:hypothetical protein
MTLHIMLVMDHTLVAEMELIGSGVVPTSFLLLSTLAFSGMHGQEFNVQKECMIMPNSQRHIAGSDSKVWRLFGER